MDTSLDSIRIVLLNTFHPGNIGAVARAMKTMGLQELVLVAPNEFPSEEATSRAAGAADVLANAIVVSTFEQAIYDCHQVFATTARQKQRFDRPQKSCESAAQWIKNNAHEKVAIVFGRERTGMSANDINLCQQILYIPGNPEYDVLNMASAVQIVCYELNKTFSENASSSAENNTMLDSANLESQSFDSNIKPNIHSNTQAINKLSSKNKHNVSASQQELNAFYQHLESSLESSGYINSAQPSDTMKRLRQFFSRSHPTSADIGMMRGVIKALARNGD